MSARTLELAIVLGACLAATGALGCGKTDVGIGANGRPLLVPAWAAPTPENGFHAVEPRRGRCPPQGYQMTSAARDEPDEPGENPAAGKNGR